MMRKSIAVLLYPGAIFFEIALAVDVLAAHADIRYFTPEGEIHQASNGACMEVHGCYADLALSGSSCVLVPGGNPDSIMPGGKGDAALQAAQRNGAVVAGICAGNLVLARAGLLRGHSGTHNYTDEHASPQAVALTAPYWEGMLFKAAAVVVDKLLITAQPWAYVAFTAAVAEALDIFDKTQAQQFIRYHSRQYSGEE